MASTSGTSPRNEASVLFAQKYGEKNTARKGQRIFFGISERDGKTSRGGLIARPGAAEAGSPWERVDHDLGEVVAEFHEFCLREALLLEG